MGRVELLSIRNLIWSRNTKTRKIVTVAWQTVCSPIKVGGLGLRLINCMNKVSLLKLTWEILTTNLEWAQFYRQRFGIGSSCTKARYFKSSI
ncbi:hypothetical protein Lal_00004180 [Lupinus albus]|nr:hypothetical protein Lal_00004180 [Lupinus albus]